MAEQKRAEGAVQRALELQLFGKFATRESILPVAETAGLLLKNNPERIGYVIVNTGNIKVTFALRRDVTDGKGFVLPAEGDTLSVNYIEDGQFPTHELSAIASAAGGEVSVLEFIRVNV